MDIYWRLGLIVLAMLWVAAGCKQKQDHSAPSPAARPDIAPTVAAMTAGMKSIPVTTLSQSHVGASCVLVVQPAEGGTVVPPPPPPVGMVCLMGPTTLYKGALRSLSADSIEIQAPYPTAGHFKVIQIPRPQIQSVYLAR